MSQRPSHQNYIIDLGIFGSSKGTYRRIVLILKRDYDCSDLVLSNAVLIIYLAKIVTELRQFKLCMILMNSFNMTQPLISSMATYVKNDTYPANA